MIKHIKLINNERKDITITSAKACKTYDKCYKEDKAKDCGYDRCVYDYHDCGPQAWDSCDWRDVD